MTREMITKGITMYEIRAEGSTGKRQDARSFLDDNSRVCL
jgi:hypothetical protein